ncbi:Lar family restriction alleviation protein [Pseudomonas aeruginosa]|nr:Lar family restriction alleviation protein [Pseudomonas aeruginosa]
MTNANECTCPSGDGSLAHPCPAHPASVKQTGGDERDLQAEGAQGELLPCPFCGGQAHLTYDDYVHDDLRPMPVVECNACHTWVRAESWNKRAALAQPSPAQAEAEQPEVVAFIHERTGAVANAEMVRAMEEGSVLSGYSIGLVTLAQHDRIFGALRADRDSWAEQAEQRLADWDEMRKERDAALARVAELETALEPFAAVADAYDDSEDDDHEPYTDMGCDDRLRLTLGQHRAARIALEGRTPQAQAQQLHDLDKQCRDDVARALGLRPNQERGFAWSYLLASIKSCVKASEDSAQAQHSVPEGLAEFSQFLSAVMDAAGLVRYGRRSKELSEYLGAQCMKYRLSAPVAQAQHSVPEGWMLVECGIWTQEQVDEMQKTVARFRNSELVDDRALAMAVADAGQCKAPEISLAELLAAAPGKEGV